MSLATRHGKWRQFAPVFDAILGVRVVDANVDTDRLGTFAGEIPRSGSAIDTAVAKARLGMAASGLPRGLASEGTIGAHPVMPMITVDEELAVFVDDDLGICVAEVEVALGIPAVSVVVGSSPWDDGHLVGSGFPEHGVIVHPEGAVTPMFKGIHDVDSLQRAVEQCGLEHPGVQVRIESDFRALHHPVRQRVIGRAAERLALRLAALCPACDAPGWGISHRSRGAPCSLCGATTLQVCREHHSCPRCDHTESRAVAGSEAVDPAHCPRCNP